MSDLYVLPDLLESGLKVVFCGTAAGAESAKRRAYYAGLNNKFWRTLHEIGLTPHRLNPSDYRQLLQFGIGLTDIAKTYSGADSGLRQGHFDRSGLRFKIEKYAPRAFAFNSKEAAKRFYKTNQIEYGQQPETVGVTTMFVLPSTSGAASGPWNIAHWQRLADFLNTR
ncbi:MAG: mismatch-specific DNA-glycosylase [Chloroflexota bacterium]